MKHLLIAMTVLATIIIPVNTVGALTAGDTTTEVRYTKSDVDGNPETPDEYDAVLVCFTGSFNDRVSEDEYDTLQVDEVSSTPVTVLSGGLDTAVSTQYSFTDVCYIGANLGDNHLYRACAIKAGDETVEPFCNADIAVTIPPEYPAEPVTSDTDRIIEAIHDTAQPFYQTMALASALLIFYGAYRLILYPFFRKSP